MTLAAVPLTRHSERMQAPIAHTHQFHLPNDAATSALGRSLARWVSPGLTLLLQGPIGAGKSHLARAFIRARLGPGTEVPSPSFTLVQAYDDPEHSTEIWHADLYRLGHPDEVAELGLEQAFSTAICLVEWPDRLGRAAPETWIRLHLTPKGEGRALEVSASAPRIMSLFLRHEQDWRE